MVTIEDIVNSRDAALRSLNNAIDKISNEIAITTTNNLYLKQLTKQSNDLTNQKTAVLNATDRQVLNRADVLAATAQLQGISTQMTQAAHALLATTEVLNDTAKILVLGQQYVNLIANVHKAV